MSYWINRPATLEKWLQKKPSRIGLDTEFIRERTYWPKLALVQISIEDDILLVDPLVNGMVDAIKKWLIDPSILKIMHSPSEDLVAFKHYCQALPFPLYDTQMAASLAGIGGGMGYQKLVEQTTGINLPKGETRSNWLYRPLTEAQLEYAADDVRYLFELHDSTLHYLNNLQRKSWFDEDTHRILENAKNDNVELWPHLSIKSAQSFDREAQCRLLRLLRWRDYYCRTADKPRNWVLDNELAYELARKPFLSRVVFQSVLESHPKAPRKLAAIIWDILQTPLNDEAEAPLITNNNDANKNLVKKLQTICSECSANLGLPDGILASRRHLESLIDTKQWPTALQGWRQELLQPLFLNVLK